MTRDLITKSLLYVGCFELKIGVKCSVWYLLTSETSCERLPVFGSTFNISKLGSTLSSQQIVLILKLQLFLLFTVTLVIPLCYLCT